jgi:hypothetical protein
MGVGGSIKHPFQSAMIFDVALPIPLLNIKNLPNNASSNKLANTNRVLYRLQ